MIRILLFTISITCSDLVFSETLLSTGDVFLRESPPNGLFCSKGKSLGVLKKGSSVKLLKKVEAVCGLFFKYNFYFIEYTDINGVTQQAYVSSVDNNGFKLFTKEGE